ncbi:cysteine synthase family protein [Serratia plymuthica]|uniref:PLP-dependent cysteine synthase family protein n=1 Tax=Serratia plymuthica TaxID=82996 RepID=UPI001BAE6F2B|nr:cysteine synthase family protein [Serratia plymuthica]QUY46442.1 cysteine synthase family protein [Serratia plymuthica]
MSIRTKVKENSLLSLIGNTPVVNILQDKYPLADVKVKLESYNPGGSIKDRVAQKIIEDAEINGLIKPGFELVEATSGNTGLGLAWIGRFKGYRVTIITHDRVSKEKISLLKHYGANVIIMPSDAPADSDDNYVNVARRYANEKERFFCDQFFNHSNSLAHYQTTAPELWVQGGRDTDIIICGVGSGGTLMGISRYFREKGSKVRFVVADPQGSIYKSYFSGQEYLSGEWKIEGIGSNFIPGILDAGSADEVYSVSDDEAFFTCELVRKDYSIDVGLSSGAIISTAINILKNESSKRIMCIAPDSGERYLSKLLG